MFHAEDLSKACAHPVVVLSTSVLLFGPRAALETRIGGIVGFTLLASDLTNYVKQQIVVVVVLVLQPFLSIGTSKDSWSFVAMQLPEIIHMMFLEFILFFS